ncbi:MAG TPA: VWA domain-containing protein, partial [Pyrinomonadaceae bacterium]|nr:VWA domain-containing protein [Pyrinomonadaceae bacterium]
MKYIPAAVLLGLTLLNVSISAQKASPTPPNNKDDVVVITTNLIQVDATVTDKDGNIVTDLKADDFEIYENGKLQPITNFSFINLQPEKASQPGTGKTEKPAKNAPLAPSVPTILRPEQVRRTIALIVDDLGLSFASTKWTQEAMKKFVDEQMQPGDLVAVIRTGSGIGALQQFTSDKRLLYAAIEKIRWNTRGRGGVGSFAPIEPNFSEQLSGVKEMGGGMTDPGGDGGPPEIQNVTGMKEEREFQRDVAEAQENIFAAGTLGAVNYVMRGMGQIPGRKAVMLFSDGFKLFSRKGPSPRIIDAMQRLTDTANRAGVIIYTIDARGLETPFFTAADDTFGLSDEQRDQRITERSNDLQDTQQSLRELAYRTGGFAIINQNNLSKGVERVLNDQKGYYLIGYQPDDDIFDPAKRRFNKLIVKLKRPGLKIRYRSGFFGITDDKATPQPTTPADQLIAALTSPFAAKDIDMRMTSVFTGEKGSDSVMRSLLFINGRDLKFKEDGDGWQKAEFEVVAMTFGDNGQIVDQINRIQTIKAKAESLQDVYKNGLVASVDIPIKKPGAYQLRIAIRDSGTARIGSVNQYIEVPNLKKNKIALSGI